MALWEAIARRLAEAFAASGLTQQQVGERAGISQSQTSKYLRGQRVPDLVTLDALCAALGLDIGEVVSSAAQGRRS